MFYFSTRPIIKLFLASNFEDSFRRIYSGTANRKGWAVSGCRFPDSDDSITRENDRLSRLSGVHTSSIDSSSQVGQD
jgi:hypothetical protein